MRRKQTMKRGLIFGIITLVLAACAREPEKETTAVVVAAPSATAQTPDAGDGAKWTATDGIMNPESVYVDSASGFIFSSQVVGMPDQRDGKGYISKLSNDGKVITAEWVSGFNAPKG